MSNEYIDGFDPEKYIPLIKLIAESIQHNAFYELYTLSKRRSSLERVIGKRHLSDEELETFKYLMHECLNSAISGFLNTLDNYQDYMESLNIVSKGELLNGEDRLQATFHSEGLGITREFLENININNYVELVESDRHNK